MTAGSCSASNERSSTVDRAVGRSTHVSRQVRGRTNELFTGAHDPVRQRPRDPSVCILILGQVVIDVPRHMHLAPNQIEMRTPMDSGEIPAQAHTVTVKTAPTAAAADAVAIPQSKRWLPSFWRYSDWQGWRPTHSLLCIGRHAFAHTIPSGQWDTNQCGLLFAGERARCSFSIRHTWYSVN